MIFDVIISLISHILFLVDVHDRIELTSSFSWFGNMHEKFSQVLNHHLLLRHHSQHDNFSRLLYESNPNAPVGSRQNHCVPKLSGGIPAESLRSKQLSGIQEGRISIIIVEHLWNLN